MNASPFLLDGVPVWMIKWYSYTGGACLVIKLYPTLCNAMDCSLQGSSVCGIFQTRILECVAISFSRGSFQLRDQTHISCIAGRLLIFLKLKVIVLQNCVGFYQISTWISHRYTSRTSLPLPPHSTPLGCYRAPVWVPLAIKQILIGYLNSLLTEPPGKPKLVNRSQAYSCYLLNKLPP